MSLTCSPASAASRSASSGPECEPSPSAKSTPIAGPSCESTGQMSLFSEMSKRSRPRLWPTPDTMNHRDGTKLRKDNNLAAGGRHGVSLHHAVLILSAAASPVRTSVVAGRGAGIGGARSGLWSEMFRLTGELRPGYLVVENVPALLVRGLDVVLGDLASIGFDAEWDCLRACDFGAPHERERLWLVAYPSQHDHVANRDGQGGRAADVADAKSNRCGQGWTWRPDPSRAREQQSALQAVASPDSEPTQRASVAWTERDPWAIEPDVARMAHGIPDGLDRRRALGNALIPQTSEWIGRRILAFEQERPA